jgi:pimeloyl-ACP methyl ester carboxylesterase
MEHAKVNGVELADEVVGSGEAVLFIHGAHLADALQPPVAEPALARFRRIRYHRRGLGGSTRPAETGPTSVTVQAKDAVGSSTTSQRIARTWWGTPWVERSPWSSRPSTPPGWRRWCSWNWRFP